MSTSPLTLAPEACNAPVIAFTDPLSTPGSLTRTTERPSSWWAAIAGVTVVMNWSRCATAESAASRSERRPAFSRAREVTWSESVFPICSFRGPAPSTMPTASARKTDTSDTTWYLKSIITHPALDYAAGPPHGPARSHDSGGASTNQPWIHETMSSILAPSSA